MGKEWTYILDDFGADEDDYNLYNSSMGLEVRIYKK